MNPTLKQAHLTAEQLCQLVPVAIYITDALGRVTGFNPAMVEMLGYSPVVGKPLQLVEMKGNELETPANPAKIVISRSSDHPVYLHCYSSPYYDESGTVAGTIHTLIDRTEAEQLKAENEQLQSTKERFHKMVEEVEDYAILLLDRSGTIQNWNTGAEKIKGYTEAEIIGKNFRIFYLPEDRQIGLPETLIHQAMSTGKAIHEGWRVRKDGSRFWGSVVITALHNDEGEIIGFTKVTRDLSERKITEDQIKKYASDLEFQNKELEQFAYAASHDLKEPIRKILFYNSYIADNSGGNLDERSREYLSRSLGACRRMQQLIEDILSYTKTTVLLDRYEKVDINDIIADIITVHRDDFEANSVTIQSGKMPVVKGIAFQLKQLFENLISNSIKYRHSDRQSLIILDCVVKPGADVEGGDVSKHYYNISVTDNGMGFDQSHASKIFEIFQRLQGRSHSPGSGIGLAICKRIVQNHQGIITAVGSLDKGARFDIYLPLL